MAQPAPIEPPGRGLLEGRTVVMCTHLLVEAEGLADQIVVLEAGTDLMSGSQTELMRRYWPNDLVRIDATDRTALDRIASWDGVLRYDRNGGAADVHLDTFDRVPDLVDALIADGVRVTPRRRSRCPRASRAFRRRTTPASIRPGTSTR